LFPIRRNSLLKNRFSSLLEVIRNKTRSDHRMGTLGNEEQGLQTIILDWYETAKMTKLHENEFNAPDPPLNYYDGNPFLSAFFKKRFLNKICRQY